MSSLIHNPLFKEKLEEIMTICREHKCSASIAVSDENGDECYVSLNGSSDDVAFMTAQVMFDFCKQVAEADDVNIEDLAKLTYKEFTGYYNLMLQEEYRQLILLNKPIGRA